MNADSLNFEENDALRSSFIRDITLRQLDAPPHLGDEELTGFGAIPKTLVRYWHDPSELPGDVRACLDSWDRLKSEGFMFHLFSDETAARYIAEEYGTLESQAFARCSHPAMRSDYPDADKGMYFDNSSPFGPFLACHSWVGTSTLCGLAYDSCPTNQAAVLSGCLSSIAGYQRDCRCGGVGDPVDPITGNLFERVTDFATSGPNPLSATRLYNSDVNYLNRLLLTSRFGFGWRSEYDRRLYFNFAPPSASVIDATSPDGTPLHFSQLTSGWVLQWFDFTTGWSNTPRTDVNYSISTDGTFWYLTDGNDTVDKYSNDGRLQTITYRGGYQQALTYDASGNNTVVSDSLGRQITFTYTGNGVVDTLTDPDGNVTHYAYLDRGTSPAPPGSPALVTLQQVVYPATAPSTPTLTYLYEDTRPINSFALTGLTDENGNRFATWSYDDQGRVLSSVLAGGANSTTISYNDTTNTRTVTNALSKQSVYNTGTFQGTLQLSSIAGLVTAHTAASTVTYAYDTNGYVSQITDANGNINKYTHDATGQETSRTEGFGTAVARTITTTWDATWREPDEIVAPNLTTDFTYDVTGRLSQFKLTDTTTQTVPYSTGGQTRIWNYAYTALGLLQTVDGPLVGSGDTTTYGYDIHGFVNSITDVLGHITTISSSNGRGQPLTSVDPNGIPTNYAYDQQGRILGVTVNPGAGQSQTGFTYDLAGNLTVITRPDGSTLTYAYDNAHRVTSVTNNLGESITYTLDALGNRTATTTKATGGTIAKQETATFDELGRVMANIGAASQTTSHSYDLNDNEISTTDPRSKVYGHAFDALNRLYQETDPNSYHTTLAYDAQDNATSVSDARSLVTAYIRNGFGDVIRQTSPDTGITDFWYDANGAVIKQIDARAVETDFTNDNAGRVLTKTFPAATAENVAYTYDATVAGNKGVGRLTSVTDQSGSAALVYDGLGHETSDTRVIAGHSYGVTYTFDSAGNILTETYPSGRIVTYARDALGRISGITTKQTSGSSAVTLASSVTYMPFGSISALTYGNGAVATLTYDQDYQLTGITTAAGATGVQNLTNGFDPAGNITSIADSLTPARSQTVTYDNLNRVATASGAYGAQSYTYDGVGNRATRVLGATTETYAYAPTANRIATITAGANVRSFSYANSGQVTQDVRDPTHTYAFVPNNNGRNGSATLNAATVGTYLYNAFEQRAQKVAGATTTQFVYDQAGHLLAEANASGVTQKEYIWLDDLPVAMIDDTGASPVIYYIHTDQLGTPQKITDASINVVWDGVFDPFGNAFSGIGGAQWGAVNWGGFNWGTSGSNFNNLRFPGQYFDAEASLSQNWNRDYDSTAGRYVQSDATGLLGGINTYLYAGANTLTEIDPTGARAVRIPVPTPLPPIVIPGTPENQQWTRFALRQLQRLATLCFGDGVDCGEQLKKCKNMCLSVFVEDKNSLPGSGPDYFGRMRRCIRECMEANGCRNF